MLPMDAPISSSSSWTVSSVALMQLVVCEKKERKAFIGNTKQPHSNINIPEIRDHWSYPNNNIFIIISDIQCSRDIVTIPDTRLRLRFGQCCLFLSGTRKASLVSVPQSFLNQLTGASWILITLHYITEQTSATKPDQTVSEREQLSAIKRSPSEWIRFPLVIVFPKLLQCLSLVRGVAPTIIVRPSTLLHIWCVFRIHLSTTVL